MLDGRVIELDLKRLSSPAPGARAALDMLNGRCGFGRRERENEKLFAPLKILAMDAQ